MGYHSNVVLACAFPTEQQVVGYITKQRLLETFSIWNNHLKNYLKVWTPPLDPKEGMTCVVAFVQIDDVKWYEDYEDVKALKKFFRDSEKCGGAWIELAVGEDNATSVESGYDEGYVLDRAMPDSLPHSVLQEYFYTHAYISTPHDTDRNDSCKPINDFIKEAKL